MAYFEGSAEKWQLISEVQSAKRETMDLVGMDGIRSDRHVMTNPVTGREPSMADLRYALRHMQQIYETGQIREDRFAFLWYH